MKTLDPRVQLAWLAALVGAALVGAGVGVAAAAAVALGALVVERRLGGALRTAVTVLPLAAAIGILDALAGDSVRGLVTGGRVVALVLGASAFTAVSDGEALVDALRWLRVPFDVTFALVTGARLVPLATADLADLADTARLRGIDVDGPPLRRLAAWTRLLVPLLVVTVRRGLRLGEAMELRAFAPGRPRTVRHRLRWRARDSLALAAALLYLSAIVAMVL